jgi:hypothetical protein
MCEPGNSTQHNHAEYNYGTQSQPLRYLSVITYLVNVTHGFYWKLPRSSFTGPSIPF